MRWAPVHAAADRVPWVCSSLQADVRWCRPGYARLLSVPAGAVDGKTYEQIVTQAVTVVNARVEALTNDAIARRKAIEARVAELQAEARAYPEAARSFARRHIDVRIASHGLPGAPSVLGHLIFRLVTRLFSYPVLSSSLLSDLGNPVGSQLSCPRVGDAPSLCIPCGPGLLDLSLLGAT